MPSELLRRAARFWRFVRSVWPGLLVLALLVSLCLWKLGWAMDQDATWRF